MVTRTFKLIKVIKYQDYTIQLLKKSRFNDYMAKTLEVDFEGFGRTPEEALSNLMLEIISQIKDNIQ